MTKKNIIKQYISFLTKNDIIIFAGKSICQEASKYSDLNILCLDDDCGYGLSIAFGIAMSTKKRVCIICDDYYLLKDVGAVVHMGISKLKNLFIIIIRDGYYPFVQNMPTIESNIPNFKGLLFGSGFLINDYSHYFKTQTLAKTIKSWVTVMKGPLALFIDFDKKKEIEECHDKTDYNVVEQIVKLKTIINDEITSLFTAPTDILKTIPPLTMVGKVEEK
jgi:hypothetical protein